jgi:predicted dehydrogenase
LQKISLANCSVLAVVGGGRWSRVIISVLMGMKFPFDKVVIVSENNTKTLIDYLNSQSSEIQEKFSIVNSLTQLSKTENVKAAIVANSARLHFSTASELLRHRISLLVEKPLALKLSEASILIDCAKDVGVALIPSLQYRFCSYLHLFKRQICTLDEKPISFSFYWSDCAGEDRYGEKKTYDYSLNVALDVMPHVWSILSIVFDDIEFSIESCAIEFGGRIAHFSLANHELYGKVSLERDANSRQRFLIVRSKSGETISIDFSVEPGHITFKDGMRMSSDPNWENSPKPVTRQLSHFFSIEENALKYMDDSQAILGSVGFSENASNMLQEQQKATLRKALELNHKIENSVRLGLRELLSDALIKHGMVSIGDNDAIERKVVDIVECINSGSIFNSEYAILLEEIELTLN